MNLYGEYGNIKLLTRSLEEKGASVTVFKKTVTDTEIRFTDYDFIYCGAGTERHRTFALEHLKQFGESLRQAFDSGKVFLFTGNSWEMLGKSITTAQGAVTEGVGLFDFTVKEQQTRRLTGDIHAKTEFIDEDIIGFINKCSSVQGVASPMLTLTLKPDCFEFTTEGIHQKNFFGTQVIGPLLVKNPTLSSFIAELIIDSAK